MAISPIELNGTVSRMQDYSIIKHNEDMKVAVDQANFQTSFEKKVEEKSGKVVEGENTQKEQQKFDAKEKGNNEYHDLRDKSKKKENKEADGKVIVKGMNSFDIKI